MNKYFVYKKWISFTIVVLIVGMSVFPSVGQFVSNVSEENNVHNLEIPRKRVLLTSCTHWGGIEYDGIAADDIQDWIKSVKYLNPDYILHLGDITDYGEDEEFVQAYENFSEIIKTTNVDRVWAIGGGGHDGLVGDIPIEEFFRPKLKQIIEKIKLTKIGEKLYQIIGSYTKFLRAKFKLGFYQILNQTSQWYTLKIGNNVFIMVGYFQQPWTWSSGHYGGIGGEIAAGDLLNMNKVNWLNRTLARWNGTGNNIFICHHFPLRHTNIYTHKWAGMKDKRFIYESGLIMDILSRYTDVVAWLSGHVHVDSNATYSSHPKVSKGTAVSGASRPDLPDHVHFVCCGDIWKEHGMAGSSFSNFRYFDLVEDQAYVDIKAWDSTNNKSATMTVNNSESEVEEYRIQLPYPVSNLDVPLIYEQAWDVYDYCELRYPWYQDNEGLRRSRDGWIESRWDFWEEKDFSQATLEVDTSNPNALFHRIYYSNDCMKTWNEDWYTTNNLTSMPSARWVKIITEITTKREIFIRDISFEFP